MGATPISESVFDNNQCICDNDNERSTRNKSDRCLQGG